MQATSEPLFQFTNMKVVFDQHGYPKPVLPAEMTVLADLLVEDIQRDITWCNELLAIIDDIESGKATEWNGTGNAHSLKLTSTGASITNEYTEEALTGVPLSFFAKVITDWRNSIMQ